MPDYSKGKIYKITNKDDNRVYIGSTVQTLSFRKSQHISKKNTLNRDFNWDNIEMTILENISCLNRTELLIAERKYIEANECVNDRIPIRTKEEINEYRMKHNIKQNIKSAGLPTVKCSVCNTTYTNKYKYNIHIKTQKHLKNITSSHKSPASI